MYKSEHKKEREREREVDKKEEEKKIIVGKYIIIFKKTTRTYASGKYFFTNIHGDLLRMKLFM